MTYDEMLTKSIVITRDRKHRLTLRDQSRIMRSSPKRVINYVHVTKGNETSEMKLIFVDKDGNIELNSIEVNLESLTKLTNRQKNNLSEKFFKLFFSHFK